MFSEIILPVVLGFAAAFVNGQSNSFEEFQQTGLDYSVPGAEGKVVGNKPLDSLFTVNEVRDNFIIETDDPTHGYYDGLSGKNPTYAMRLSRCRKLVVPTKNFWMSS